MYNCIYICIELSYTLHILTIAQSEQRNTFEITDLTLHSIETTFKYLLANVIEKE